MKIELRFFAGLREALGRASETFEVPPHVHTVDEVRTCLQTRGGIWADALAAGRSVRMAYDQQMCEADTVLVEGGEVAFFPPVTGG